MFCFLGRVDDDGDNHDGDDDGDENPKELFAFDPRGDNLAAEARGQKEAGIAKSAFFFDNFRAVRDRGLAGVGRVRREVVDAKRTEIRLRAHADLAVLVRALCQTFVAAFPVGQHSVETSIASLDIIAHCTALHLTAQAPVVFQHEAQLTDPAPIPGVVGLAVFYFGDLSAAFPFEGEPVDANLARIFVSARAALEVPWARALEHPGSKGKLREEKNRDDFDHL